MFFLHIKLLGGPPDFFSDHLEEKCGPGDNHAKAFAKLYLFQLFLNSSLSNEGITEGSESILFTPSLQAFTHNTGDVVSYAHTQVVGNPEK